MDRIREPRCSSESKLSLQCSFLFSLKMLNMPLGHTLVGRPHQQERVCCGRPTSESTKFMKSDTAMFMLPPGPKAAQLPLHSTVPRMQQLCQSQLEHLIITSHKEHRASIPGQARHWAWQHQRWAELPPAEASVCWSQACQHAWRAELVRHCITWRLRLKLIAPPTFFSIIYFFLLCLCTAVFVVLLLPLQTQYPPVHSLFVLSPQLLIRICTKGTHWVLCK